MLITKTDRYVTVLPVYAGKGQLPGQQVLDLPAELISKGDLRVCIRKEAGSNAVISEIWLESKAN